jgi:hypothetical protein
MIALWVALLARADDPPLHGLPDAAVPELGLGAPTIVEGTGERRYPLDGGGFVRVLVFADAVAADAGFDGFARTATSAPWPTGPALPGVDRALGDGGMRLVRVQNVVLFVRDPTERADERVVDLVTRIRALR